MIWAIISASETNLPLVGENNRMAGIHSLEINLSGRFDSYTAEASIDGGENVDNEYEAFSPRIGVAWYPHEDLKIRANWTESFRAPTLNQLFQRTRISSGRSFESLYSFFSDPFAPTTPVPPPPAPDPGSP